jgi:hypothetical protein
VAAPSTLSDSFNHSVLDGTSQVHNTQLIYHLQRGADSNTTHLFGQVDACGEVRAPGDGILDVYDMSTLLSYLFHDFMYSSLPLNPSSVPTTTGRNGVVGQHGSNLSRAHYAFLYSQDSCTFHTPSSASSSPVTAPGRRRLVSSQSMRVHIAPCACHVGRLCIYMDQPTYMIFLHYTCVDASCSVDPHKLQSRVYNHPNGFAVSAATLEEEQTPALTESNNCALALFVNGPIRLSLSTSHAYASSDQPYELRPPVGNAPTPRQVSSPSRSYELTPMPLNGTWTTLTFPGIPLRIHAVLSGITASSVHLSSKRFDPNDRPVAEEVRVTQLCEDCRACATVQTSLSGRTAISHNTLELFQAPILSACPMEIHIYNPMVPEVEYMIVSDSSGLEQPKWTTASCIDRHVVFVTPTTPFSLHWVQVVALLVVCFCPFLWCRPPRCPPPPQRTCTRADECNRRT